ncbi:MAG: 7-cyano-7-deazaguanine synthase QueC [Planctomycetota bacterium]
MQAHRPLDWLAAARAGETAIALLSGGLDSGVALASWCASGGQAACALTADYGQRAAAAELRAAERLARRLRVPWHRLDLAFLADPSRRAGSALVDLARSLPATSPAMPGDAGSAAAVWVPARNVVLCAAAAAFAEAAAAGVVLAGFNAEEAATFPDNSPAFISTFNAMLAHGCRRAVRVLGPTLALAKVDIVAAARRLGLEPDDFWSCYEGGDQPCRRCESCVRSARAWAAA